MAVKKARSGYAALALCIGGELPGWGGRRAIHVEFEGPGNHDEGLRPVSILGPDVTQRCVTAGEQTATEPSGVLNDPVSAGVLANH